MYCVRVCNGKQRNSLLEISLSRKKLPISDEITRYDYDRSSDYISGLWHI